MEIIDYPNYLIYEDGRVLNQKRKRYLKEQNNRGGYMNVCLYHNGKQGRRNIHRLIAIHYIPNPENKKEVDHINRIRTDNRIENLRWVSNLENHQNMSFYKSNKSGHKHVSSFSQDKRWRYQKTINKIKHQKYFKSKIDAICYKYIIQLRIKSEHFLRI
jgi:hypothetical protein